MDFRNTLLGQSCLNVSLLAGPCCLFFALGHSASALEPRVGSVGLVDQRPASERFVETDQGFMVAYEQTIPGTDVLFAMVPVPGGTLRMGSRVEEAERNEDEGPQVRIALEPFWIGKYEVTWAEYMQYMALYEPFKQFEQLQTLLAVQKSRGEEGAAAVLDQAQGLRRQLGMKPTLVDGLTCPTPLYEPENTFESGDDPSLPAVTMTPFAARQYTKWLSLLTGSSYRLPAEAEWEYAARAGTRTATHFGDDLALLGEYAWYLDNAEEVTHVVGQKKPNAWGLYDMLGNVAEMVLDQYDPAAYARFQDHPVTGWHSIHWPTEPGGRVVRGGYWDSDPDGCRSAVRMATEDEDWKLSDPNLPLSPWWYAEFYPAGGVGFRIVRQLQPLTEAERIQCWDAADDMTREDVQDRVSEGRGSLGYVHPDLPTVLEQLRSKPVQALLE